MKTTKTQLSPSAIVAKPSTRNKGSTEKISIAKIKKSCVEVCAILKALSHPQRLIILSHLLKGPRTVSELIELCDISQSQMSQFLIRMKFEGLLSSMKNGKFQCYSISDARLIHLMKTIQKEYCRTN